MNNEHMDIEEFNIQDPISKLNEKWTEKWNDELVKRRNFKHLFIFSEQTLDFIKNVEFLRIYWKQNYHQGRSSQFEIVAKYRTLTLKLQGPYGMYIDILEAKEERTNKLLKLQEIIPLIEEEEQEEVMNWLDEINLYQYLIDVDGDNWVPDNEESDF